MKKLLFVPFAIFISVNMFCQQTKDTPTITADEIHDHISYLASDDLEGRFSGSEGNYKAGEYIKNEFEKSGLLPFFGESYFQDFKFIESVELTGDNSLVISTGKETQKLKLNEDFTPLGFSGKVNIATQLVFAGYGISAPDLKYDDYADIDVKGKIVLVMRYNPEYDKNESAFDDFSSFRKKTSVAKEKGAAGIIFVNGYEPKSDDELYELKYDGAPGIHDFGVVSVKREIADKFFESQNMNFSDCQKRISETKAPSSFLFKNVTVNLATGVTEVEKTSRNVAGFLPSANPEFKDQYIVIGGHYDHIGYGQTGSRYAGKDKPIHNGADDNASGVTGVLELAEKFSSMKDKINRNIIFVTFSGEELGLLGSSFFVNNLPIDVKKIIAMMNMDMIGRLNNEDALTVIGVGSSAKWKDMLTQENKYGFNLLFNESAFGGSDHTSFTIKEIPSLFFFTGIHEDYHMPGDDTEKINSKGEENILNYVFDIVGEIDLSKDKPGFVQTVQSSQKGMGRSKIKVGTIPEFSYQGVGYKISGVTPGSAAEKGGLKAGDIIIKFAGKEVGNIYDFMAAMNDVSAGDTVDVVVKRLDEQLTFRVELVAN